MTPSDLIRKARASGVHLEAKGDRLRVSGRASVPADIIDELRRHKAEVVALLALRESGGRDCQQGAAVAMPAPQPSIHDLLDAFEERAAIREYDGGQSRPEAEAAALAEVAQAAGMTSEALRETLRARLSSPSLDPDGLPFAACPACRGRDWWKPADMPFEGPGWHCAACTPPQPNLWRHAVSVPATKIVEQPR